MSQSIQPPRLAIWLLTRRLSPDWRDFIVGDLAEEFLTRGARSRFSARAWFWWQAVRCVLAPPPVHSNPSAIDIERGESAMSEEFLSDLRYATRAMRRRPGFAALAIGIMTLGIGANTAMFSVVYGVLMKPLTYPGSERIVTLRTTFQATGVSQRLVSIANYRDWRDQSSSFEAMASYRPGEFPATPGETAEYAHTASVDAQFFRVFGVQPILGRTFTPDETVPETGRVVVISHAYWQSRLGGDPRVLERTIRLLGTPRSIVGVLPPGFRFPGETDIWSPQTTSSTSRTGHNFFAVGRLKPDSSLQQAQTELDTIGARLEQHYPESNKGRGVLATSLQDELVGGVRLTLYLLWGVVGVVLLIACANTATLLLGKATARTREIAVRTALGAGRGRIVRQLITESLVLALAAGAIGIALAYWGAKALVAMSPAEVIRLTQPGIDGGVLAFTVGISLVTSLLFGLVPALHASRVDLIEAVNQSGGRSGIGGRIARTRGILVASEVALAVVLLTGAGLLLKSLAALHRTDLGFRPENVLVVRATGLLSRTENNTLFSQIMSRIAGLPGVIAVGATSVPPGDFNNAGTGGHRIEGERERERGLGSAFTVMTIVAPGSFAALGIPFKSGRDFNESDSDDRPLVAIVNEALVRTSIPGQEPVGRTIFCSFDRGKEPMTIVGVVGDVRQRNPALAPMPECYMPYQQHSYNSATLNLVVRTAGDPAMLGGAVRRIVSEVAPDVPVALSTMEERVAEGVEDPRFRALLFGIFAALAVCLAMAGVYGVMAYAVEQRSKEIGLRMALGASKASVLRLILGQGLALAAAGLIIGLASAVAATRLLKTVLFEVQPVDLQVYLGVILLLAFVTFAAGYFPARRAAVVDPAQVLKTE